MAYEPSQGANSLCARQAKSYAARVRDPAELELVVTRSITRAWRSISRGREGALRREVLRAKPMDARTVDGSRRDSPKHDSTACDRSRWCGRPTESTDAPIQTGKIPR